MDLIYTIILLFAPDEAKRNSTASPTIKCGGGVGGRTRPLTGGLGAKAPKLWFARVLYNQTHNNLAKEPCRKKLKPHTTPFCRIQLAYQ